MINFYKTLFFFFIFLASSFTWSQCTNVTLTLLDSYGDGGGSITVEGTTYTLGSGSSEDFAICIDVTCVEFIFAATDSWSYENSWQVTDGSGSIIAQGANASGSIGTPVSANSAYCTWDHGTGYNTQMGLGLVQFGSINNTSGGSVYSNYQCNSNSTIVEPGQTYDLTIQVLYYQMYNAVGIDWNQDGDFFDSGERYALGLEQTGQPTTYSISVPPDAAAGATRMRIVSSYGNIGDDVCSNTVTYGGEGEEYGIVVAVPECASNLSPTNAGTDQSTSLTLSWDVTQYASGYNVFLGSSSSSLSLVSSNQVGTNFVPSGLSYATTYYWQVVPLNSAGQANACQTFSFTTSSPPTAPPVAEFSGSSTSISIGTSVTFTDESTETPTGWLWEVSPSTGVSYASGSSSSQNPVILFGVAGTYSVTLTASNASGSDDEVKTDYITVSCPNNLTVSYADVSHCSGNSSTLSGTLSDPNVSQVYTFTGTDSYGDGWNGASVTIDVDGAVVVNGFANQNLDGVTSAQESQTTTFSASNGQTITFSWVSGDWDGEVSYTLEDASGGIVSSGAYGGNSAGTTLSGSTPTYTYSWSPTIGLDDAANATPSTSATSNQNYTVTATSSSGCTGSDTPSLTISTPSAGTISGTTAVMPGETSALTSDGTSAGEWTSDNTSVATVNISTGVVTAVSSGTANITYAVGGILCPDSETVSFLVAYPSPETCYDMGSIPNGGTNAANSSYPWSLGTTGTPSSGTGPQGADASGGSGFYFTESSNINGIAHDMSFNFDFSSATNPMITLDYHMYGTDQGTLEVIVDGSTLWTLTGNQGNSWHSATVPVDPASLSNAQSVSVTIRGTTGASYTSDMAIDNLCILDCASSGDISGTLTVCAPGTSQLTQDGGAGGTWASDNSNATIDASGLVTGATDGTSTITYTISASGSCPQTTSSATVDVGVLTSAYGDVSTCTGVPATLTGTYVGNGVTFSWSPTTDLDDASAAIPVSSSSSDLTYTATLTDDLGCSITDDVVLTITESTAGTLSATSSSFAVDETSTVTTDGTTGGSFASSDAAVATVDASTGVVTGVSAGTVTITYTTPECSGQSYSNTIDLTIACETGTVSLTFSGINIGETSTASSTGTAGGSWSSDNTAVATVDASTGIVSGVTVGSANIIYTTSAACGGQTASSAITVSCSYNLTVAYDDVQHCSGASSILTGTVSGQSSTLLSEEFDDLSNWTAINVSTGDWGVGSPTYYSPYSGSSCTHISGGYVGATDYMEYTLPSATSMSMTYYYICQSWAGDADNLDVEYYDGSAWVSLASYSSVSSWSSATHSIPDGATKVRLRATINYGYGIAVDQLVITGVPMDTYTYSWSPSTDLDDASIAAPTASNTTTETYTISVTSSLGCTGTDDVIATVNSPTAGTLSGTTTIAPEGTTSISTDGTTGGVWESDDTAVATVDASTGVVTGVTAGSATITYAVGGTTCPDASTIAVTVSCASDLTVSYDDVSHCSGNSSLISGSVSNPNETATIYITTSGGSYSSEKYVYISTGENLGGTIVYDQGGYGLLTNQPVDVSAYIGQTLYFNAVDGYGDGWDGTSYSITDGGSTTWLSGTDPDNGTGGGGTAEVEASVAFTVTSTETYTYSWSPSTDLDDASIAAPTASNTTTETYTISVTSSLGCTGTDDVIATVSNPTAGTLSGTTTIAPEGTTTISSDGTTGGIWESDDTAVATVDASTGLVTGGIAGSATITYAVGGTACPDASTITVNVVCDAYTVVYDDVTFCDGTPTMLSQTSNSQNNTYEFYGVDQYSDGWDGASVDISVNGVTVLTGVAVLSTGESWFFDAPNGATIGFNWNSGSYNSEISWGLYDASVNLLDNGSYGVVSSTIPGSAPTYTYSWSPSTGLDDALLMEPTSSASTTTVYTVTVTDGFGCVATDDVIATVNPLYTPMVTIASSDADNEICSGDAVTFTATAVDAGNPTYVWNISGSPVSGETASTFTTTTLVDGDEVTVTVTADNTCQTVNEVTSSGITTTVNAVTAGTIESSVDGGTSYANSLQVIQAGNDIYWNYISGSATGTFTNFEYQWGGTTGAYADNWDATTNPWNWGAGQSGINPNQTIYVRAKASCGSNVAYSDPVAVDWLTCYGGAEIATSTSDGGSIVDGGNMTVNSTISWTAPTDAFGDAYHWEYSWDGGSSFNGEWQNNTNPATWSDNIGSQADNTLTVRYVATGSGSCSDNSAADFDVTVLRPVITVSAISGDLSVCSDGDASSSETFTVEGLYIANDDNAPAAAASHTGILVTAPTGLEISLDNSTFSSSLNLSATNGTVSTTTIYARIIAGQSASDVSGDIACTAQAANTQNISAVATIDENAEIETSVSFTGTTTCGEVSVDVQVNGVSAGSGAWTALSGLFLSATDVATTFITSTFGNTITLVWTSSNGACTGETTSMDVEFNQPTTSTIDGYGMDTESWIWGGLTNDDWSEASNWYAYTTDLNNNSYWERQTVNVPSATDKVYIMANSDAGQCVSSSNSAIATTGAAVTDLMVANGATLNLSGTASIKGDLTNDGTINAGSSTLIFDGTSDQMVSGNALTLDNLTVNKTTGNLIMSTPISVNGLLDLSSDVNNGSNILSVGTSSASIGSVEQNGGIVLGKLRRYFANASGSKSFPVGIAGTMRDVAVDFVSAPGTDQYITASYNTGYPQAVDGSDLYEGLPLTTSDNQLIQNYDDEGYWEIIPGSSSTGDSYIAPINGKQYNVTLHCNNLTGADNVTNIDRTKVRMIKSAGPGHTSWEALTHVSISGDDADFLLTASGIGFSFFGAGTEDDNALPVELISFSGDCNESVVELSWATASEQNSENFEIEYSRDGVDWSLIHTEPAAGFSNELIPYTFVHEQAVSGNNYYRLTQNDIDGTATIYDNLIINASCQMVSAGYFSVFPNPSSGTFQVIMNNPEISGAAKLRIVDTKGNEVFTKSIAVNSGINMYVIQQELSPGIYYISVDNGTMKTTVVKHSIR